MLYAESKNALRIIQTFLDQKIWPCEKNADQEYFLRFLMIQAHIRFQTSYSVLNISEKAFAVISFHERRRKF
jgi:hypothetical protein